MRKCTYNFKCGLASVIDVLKWNTKINETSIILNMMNLKEETETLNFAV